MGHGPALVLVHGLLGYSFSWRFALPLLAQNRQVIAIDMPGAGFSDCRGDLDCRLEGAAKRLLRFLDILGIETCDLAGSSYGGSSALMAAALAPSRVRSLILISPANPWSRIGRKRLALLRVALVARAFPAAARKLRILHRLSVRRMYGDPWSVSAETLDGYQLPLQRAGVFEHAVQIASSWRSDMQALERVMPRAADIPALIIWGTRDRLVEIGTASQIAGNFRNAETAFIEGAGHLPYEERPEEFASLVLKFLSKHSPVPYGR
jgi:pimeloyl-ACP methyl ester carboxylesterase